MEQHPPCIVFKPAGIPARELAWCELALDEYEALRLCDALGMDQAAAALAMGVSRPTLGRILERARGKVARVLVEGQALIIQGGPIELRGKLGRHGHGRHGQRVKAATKQQDYRESETSDKEEIDMPRGDGTGPSGSGGRGTGAGRNQPSAGQGRGRMGGPFAAGTGGTCLCPSCGFTEPHQRGVPCVQKRCPKCGTFMTRQP